ncbi:class I SAM-dependent methyltransferase [Actinomadura algeriensis]|uniref:S-adenosyl-L-methionine-dependent methyltransferase n=1 Tax=Actinomadura algeriensis TaxID=1679523 RepID=A0ABR9JL01_9ACTN|nr:SAM-dependent methyltransferase [Actinomadura algeriensis]MBE1531233.1 methyltransferase (TIGR00027 family) [Actinomadura algeriensis]
MNEGLPSRTALAAAAARAAHPIVDEPPHIFADPLVRRLLGGLADDMIGYHRTHGGHAILAGTRVITAVRARYAEERASGFPQYVVLGAGLDTYGLRADPGVRVFEVDHPATQEWKRGLIRDAGVSGPPDGPVFVPADFERDDPFARLRDAGFDPARPALVSWLGVSYFLTREAVSAVLAGVGALAAGSELVLDYALPPGLRDAAGRAYAELAERVAGDAAEPYRTTPGPAEVDGLLRDHGLRVVANERVADAVPSGIWERGDALRPFDFFRLVRAAVTGRDARGR